MEAESLLSSLVGVLQLITRSGGTNRRWSDSLSPADRLQHSVASIFILFTARPVPAELLTGGGGRWLGLKPKGKDSGFWAAVIFSQSSHNYLGNV